MKQTALQMTKSRVLAIVVLGVLMASGCGSDAGAPIRASGQGADPGTTTASTAAASVQAPVGTSSNATPSHLFAYADPPVLGEVFFPEDQPASDARGLLTDSEAVIIGTVVEVEPLRMPNPKEHLAVAEVRATIEIDEVVASKSAVDEDTAIWVDIRSTVSEEDFSSELEDISRAVGERYVMFLTPNVDLSTGRETGSFSVVNNGAFGALQVRDDGVLVWPKPGRELIRGAFERGKERVDEPASADELERAIDQAASPQAGQPLSELVGLMLDEARSALQKG